MTRFNTLVITVTCAAALYAFLDSPYAGQSRAAIDYTVSPHQGEVVSCVVQGDVLACKVKLPDGTVTDWYPVINNR